MVARPRHVVVMRYRFSHRTSYRYETPVSRSFHVQHLKPAPFPHQAVLNHGVLIDPAPARHDEIVDAFGNYAGLISIEDEHREFTVHSSGTIDVLSPLPPDLVASSPWEAVTGRARDNRGLLLDVLQFVCPSRHTPISDDIRNFAAASFPTNRPALAGVLDLTLRIYREFAFDPRATDISTPVERVLAMRRGVCQDFAHLMLSALRSLRIPARYMSGYLLTHPAPGKPKLKGVDASHAWVSVWVPETGWVDFDPTNGLIPRGEHITIATGRDYDDVSPISGVLLGGEGQTMAVAVDIEPWVDASTEANDAR
jgi:transglutaminase-like putative cysteine protease